MNHILKIKLIFLNCFLVFFMVKICDDIAYCQGTIDAGFTTSTQFKISGATEVSIQFNLFPRSPRLTQINLKFENLTPQELKAATMVIQGPPDYQKEFQLNDIPTDLSTPSKEISVFLEGAQGLLLEFIYNANEPVKIWQIAFKNLGNGANAEGQISGDPNTATFTDVYLMPTVEAGPDFEINEGTTVAVPGRLVVPQRHRNVARATWDEGIVYQWSSDKFVPRDAPQSNFFALPVDRDVVETQTLTATSGLLAASDNTRITIRDGFNAINGNVGIGTDDPKAKLHVRGDLALGWTPGGGSKLLLTNFSNTHYIRANNWWTEFVSHPNEGWKFLSNDGQTEIERLRITSSGNVGIGVGTDPLHKLDVAGGDIAIRHGSLRLNGALFDTFGGGDQYFLDLDVGGNIRALNVVDRVGIGTSNPSGKLTVVGSEGDGRSVTIDNKEIKFRGDDIAHFSLFANRESRKLTIENTSSSSSPGISDNRVLMAIGASGDVGINGGARINSIAIGTDIPGIDYPWESETIGVVNTNSNLRLQSPNNIILHTGASPMERMMISNDGIIYFTPRNLHTAHPSLSGSQFAIGWNHSGGRGETIFYQHGGGGYIGGFDFWSERDGIGKHLVARFEGNGNLKLLGKVGSLSDARKKTSIQPISNALSKILNLQGVYFNWRDKKVHDSKTHLGLIAQEVLQVVPEVVMGGTNEKGKEDLYSLHYDGLIPILIEAMKEQQEIINRLSERLSALETRSLGAVPIK